MTRPDAKPLPAYTEKLWKCLAQYAIDPYTRRGRKESLAKHTGIPAPRLGAILAGAPVDDKEHRAFVRVFAVLKHFPQLRLSFLEAPPAPLERLVPTPPAVRTVRPNLALVTTPSVRAAAVATTTAAPSRPAPEETPMAPAVPPPPPVFQPVATPPIAPAVAPPVLARPLLPALKARNFGEALRACREAERLTHAQVGDLVGVTGSSVGHWERNAVAPVRVCYTKLLELFPALGHAPQPKMKNGAVPTGFPKAKRAALAAERASGVPVAPAPSTTTPVTPAPSATLPVASAPSATVSVAPTAPGSPAALIAFGRALGQVSGPVAAPFLVLLRAAHAAGVDCAGLADVLAGEG